MASRSATTWLERCDAPTSRRNEPLTPRQWAQFLEAECLGYEDDVGPAGRFVVDDQRLCEQGSGTAYTLHPDVLSWHADSRTRRRPSSRSLTSFWWPTMRMTLPPA